ncbi:MAG: LPS export ABC transporter permease LptG [Betaproteobacteria bacterium RIFCSPLOWO2_12_FULL_65_14]|nr:MAG: LPS export ABC transporter permease LptG [Betaproteobacteria bacterium RIFCSPLOWO2_12_FULL_65_14]
MAVTRIPTLERYFARQIYATVGFVLLGFLALFAFFDLIKELGDLGTGDYHLRQVFGFVLLSMPTNAYELLPVAVLIGTLYVLAHLASNSEYTVMRGSGLSPGRAALALAKVGLAFVVLTFLIGEWVAPHAEEQAQKVKLRAMSSLIGQDLQSGLWFKDEGAFINVREARQANALNGVRIFDFDSDYRLRRMTAAQRAEYQSRGRWRLVDVVQTEFTRDGPRTERMPEQEWRSAVNPEMLDALIVRPERMSAWALHKYTQHLAGNRQKTDRYEIALWKKLLYPLAALVMMALALPFAYMPSRAGALGLKVFLGIMLGIFFHMLNSLFSHIGLLQNWPPFSAAVIPSAAFFAAAMLMMWWVERR